MKSNSWLSVIFWKLLFLRMEVVVIVSNTRSLKIDRHPPNLQHRTKILLTHLFGAAFKHNILLALVQPSLPHGPEVKHSVFPLQQLIQDVWFEKKTKTKAHCRTAAAKQERCRWSSGGSLTLDLSLWSFDVGQHAGHVDTVSVQVLEEDVSVAPG